MPPTDPSIDRELSELLGIITEKLQLTPTQQKLASDRYNAITKVLEEAAPNIKFDVYAQGSIALGTTVKPRRREGEEFDVDVILEATNYTGTAMPLYEWVVKTLKAHGTYKDKIDELKRCVRVSLAGEFHIDLTPGRPDPDRAPRAFHPFPDTRIEVTDTETRDWSPSNPRGLIAWFEDQCSLGQLNAKRALLQVQPLPVVDSLREKTILQQVVQLAKRARDCDSRFEDESILPRSVIVTTLLAGEYLGSGSLYSGLVETLRSLAAWLPPTPFPVWNPTNPDENFAESWEKDSTLYAPFRKWIQSFALRVENLQRLRGPKLDAELAQLFGETVARDARAEVTRRLAAERDAGRLRTTGAGLTTAVGVGTANKPHTFMGDDSD
jgi:hypothetical protein